MLRPPPVRPVASQVSSWLVGLQLLNIFVLIGVIAWMQVMSNTGSDAERLRDVAGKLRAAGANAGAAALYERYVAEAGLGGGERAKVAYTLGELWRELGNYPEALRWYYEADSLAPPSAETNQRIVEVLERMGRVHAAEAALAARAGLAEEPVADSPVVAKIGDQSITRADLERALDDLPPELQRAFGERREEFLRKMVADELLWRKAKKLGVDQDPAVLRSLETLHKQAVVGKYLEREVLSKVRVEEADLRTFFEAHRAQYQKDKAQLPFEEARPAVERDYRLMKLQAAYGELVDEQIRAAGVQLFPEALGK